MTSSEMESWQGILGVGSLLSEKSALSTFPKLRNFSLANLKKYRRVFSHPASIFVKNKIHNFETKEIASLSCEPWNENTKGFIVSYFEIPTKDIPLFIEREHDFKIVTANATIISNNSFVYFCFGFFSHTYTFSLAICFFYSYCEIA